MYIENQQFKNLAEEMISEIENFCDANDKFNVCLDTIAQAVVNPLKISYIKKDKIDKLAEHAGIVIADKPTPEQREKYFNACTLEKFANHFFDKDSLNSSELEDFNSAVLYAKNAANALLPKTFHVIDAKHIPQIYNHKHNNDSNNEPFNIGKIENLFISKEQNDINSSCMQGKRKEYFEIYNDINEDESTLKMAILTQNDEIVARALIWIDKPTNEIDRRKKLPNDKVFIDRIYCNSQTHRTATQTQLYKEVHRYFNIEIHPQKQDELDNHLHTLAQQKGIRYANGFNWYDVKGRLEAEANTDDNKNRENYINVLGSSGILFNVSVNSDSYDYYPYLDTLQFFDTYSHTLSNDADGDRGDTLKLESTCGEANNISRECEQCGSEMHEDEESYIESAEMTVCEDCCTWCDDRDESILNDDAVYNNQTMQYHHRDDLDY